MTKATTPPPTAVDAAHNPPSAPTSPLAKRAKTTMSPSVTQPTATSPSVDQQHSSVTTNVEQSAPLLIQKLSEGARAPTRGSAFAAGYDIYCVRDTVIPAHGKGFADTDIAIAVPAGTYGRIAPRSGLASKHFIDTGAGVIDADYRGPVRVLLFNHSDVDFQIKQGDRVAQLILERIYTPDVVTVDKLDESVRGAGGFGSTGT